MRHPTLRALVGRTIQVTLAAAAPASLLAQSLAARVDAAPEGRVQFAFAARPGVCGNGRTFIQLADGPGGSFYGSWNDASRAEPCTPGPVRVVLDRAGRDVLSVQAYVGPATPTTGTTDLGTVRAQDAADYLLGLAAKTEGRAGREAILPAMLADSATTTPKLVALVRDQTLPRETRRSAINWLGRAADAQPAASASVASTLLVLARDETDNLDVRRQALQSLGRLDRGAGVPPLLDLARSTAGSERTWLAREAMSALARSGDPRARDYLRDLVRRADAPDDVLTSAIRGLGTEYATARDAELLRDVFPKLQGERSRDAALSSLAEIGGAANTRWLLGIARDEGQSLATRRRALERASHAGVPMSDLISMYDATRDAQLREALIGLYAQSGDRAATDKLLQIARTDESSTVRRRVIAQLSRSDDPRVREFLKELVEK